MAKILVVDNEQRMCKIIKSGLEMEGHKVDMAFSGEAGVDCLKKENEYRILVTDLRMSGIDGIELLKQAKNINPELEVILITAFASQQTAIEAMRLGAYDYLIKPFEIDDLSLRVRRIISHQDLEAENRKLKQEIEIRQSGKLVGKSEKMREIYRLIHRVAPSDVTVLIRGESGTGKELVAEAIHQQSSRCHKKFVTVNCAAVPESLLESELFGYEKGAFTGASQKKTGFFELADGGTLLLDEIGDMPSGLQAKLLRVLQNKEIFRVGGTQKIKVDARIIASTNRDLETLIDDGIFRSDLFYRLNIFPIHVPPLREHKEDIPELIQHFLRKLDHKSITPQARRILIEYDWPGNIRQLINVLERAVIIADSSIDESHLAPEILQRHTIANPYTFPDDGIDFDEMSKNLILAALNKANGNKTRAAGLLGMTRRRLYSMMQKFNITASNPEDE